MSGEKLERYLRLLPRSLPPKRDLWPGIERSIERRSRSRGPAKRSLARARLLWPAAAAAAIIAGGAAGIVGFLRPPMDERAAILGRVREAERQYTDARNELIESLRAIPGELGKEAIGRITEELAAIDGSIGEIMAAVKRGDDGEELLYRLADFRGRQTGTLTRATALVRDVSD